MRRRLVVLVAASLTASACAGGGGATPSETDAPTAAAPSSTAPDSPGSTSAAPSEPVSEAPTQPSASTPPPTAAAGRLFTAADAEALNLHEDPPGLAFVPDSSGPTTLDDSTSPEQAAEIRSAGGVLAMHSNGFYSTTAPEASRQGVLYAFSIAMVLPDEAAAQNAFRVFLEQPNPIFLDYQSERAEGLGDEAFAFAAEHEIGDPPERHPEVGYVWRNGNALLFLQFIGVPGGAEQLDAAALRETAVVMDQAAFVMREG